MGSPIPHKLRDPAQDDCRVGTGLSFLICTQGCWEDSRDNVCEVSRANSAEGNYYWSAGNFTCANSCLFLIFQSSKDTENISVLVRSLPNNHRTAVRSQAPCQVLEIYGSQQTLWRTARNNGRGPQLPGHKCQQGSPPPLCPAPLGGPAKCCTPFQSKAFKS